MPARSINNPQHWLDRAKEARALTETIADLEAKRMMFGIADDYERLAQRAEERAARLMPLNTATQRKAPLERGLVDDQ